MKHIISIFIGTLFFLSSFSENPPEKYSINLKFTQPLWKSDVPQYKIIIDPGLEVLYKFSLIKDVQLETGFGFQFGKHYWNKEIAKLVWVDGIGWYPYETLDSYELKFVDLGIPVMIEYPIDNAFISTLTAGLNFGWHTKLDFSIEHTILNKEPEYNRFYIDAIMRIKMPLHQFNRFSLNLQPFIGYRIYLTNNNEWQKNYPCFGILVNTNF